MKLSDAVAGVVGTIAWGVGIVFVGWVAISGARYAWEHPISLSGSKDAAAAESATNEQHAKTNRMAEIIREVDDSIKAKSRP